MCVVHVSLVSTPLPRSLPCQPLGVVRTCLGSFPLYAHIAVSHVLRSYVKELFDSPPLRWICYTHTLARGGNRDSLVCVPYVCVCRVVCVFRGVSLLTLTLYHPPKTVKKSSLRSVERTYARALCVRTYAHVRIRVR